MRDRITLEGQYAQLLQDVDVNQSILIQRKLAQSDLYYLLTVICNMQFARNDWFLARCDEVQLAPDGHLDLWSRGHFKSTIITFGKTLQDILINPEVTVGIFSHTRPAAKAFLHVLKLEMTNNVLLKKLFPEIFWDKPETQSPRWSEDAGLAVKRKGNPKEGTVEASGLQEGSPVGKHYDVLVFDDIVTEETVANPEITLKLTHRWKLALNLVSASPIYRYIGTRYSATDTYQEILDTRAAIPRIRKGVDENGVSAFLSQEELENRRMTLGTHVFASQFLLEPLADSLKRFKEEWWQTFRKQPDRNKLNVYILVDPASKKKKTSDFTTMWVVGLASPKTYYVLDMIHDRMTLLERAKALFFLHEKHNPIAVAYEEYGMQADIEAINNLMEENHYRFMITPVAGNMPKIQRIERLMPSFERKEWFFPLSITYTKHDGLTTDIIHEFHQREFKAWPATRFDDGLDALSRIMDINAKFPLTAAQRFSLPTTYDTDYDVFAVS